MWIIPLVFPEVDLQFVHPSNSGVIVGISETRGNRNYRQYRNLLMCLSIGFTSFYFKFQFFLIQSTRNYLFLFILAAIPFRHWDA
jgi:hypothetical protein